MAGLCARRRTRPRSSAGRSSVARECSSSPTSTWAATPPRPWAFPWSRCPCGTPASRWAEAIRKRIVAGEDFAKIAKEESDDTSSGEKGGDLGEFKKGMMVPPFETAAFALKPGDISEPVQTPFGYHIIQVQTHKIKTLDEVKPEILAQLRPNAARQAVAEMTDKAKFILNDDFFGPEPPAAKPAPSAAAPAPSAPPAK